MDASHNPNQEEQTWAFPLALLQVTGPEVRPFLQNLLTADLRPLAPAEEILQAVPAAFLNPQGRALFVTVVVLTSQQQAWLVVPEIMRAETSRLLSRYILRTKVRLVSWQGTLGLQEPLATRPPPWQGFIRQTSAGEQYSLAWPNGWMLHWMSRPEDPAHPLPAPPSSWAAFHNQEIETGMPWILPGTSGLFLPQMLNLEQQGGLSMEKGCYPGQEIVARVHFRGQVKRHLYHGTAAQWLEPGTPLYSAATPLEQRTSHAPGHVLRMAPQGQGWKALLVAEAPGSYQSAAGVAVTIDAAVDQRQRMATSHHTNLQSPSPATSPATDTPSSDHHPA